MICKKGEKYLWLYVNIFVCYFLRTSSFMLTIYISIYIYIDKMYNIFLICEHLRVNANNAKLLFAAQVNIIGVMNGTEIALERMKKAI